MADREQVERYDAQVQELRGQVKFLEEEVGLLTELLRSRHGADLRCFEQRGGETRNAVAPRERQQAPAQHGPR